ncbi:MAG: methyltransferase domain-containing protein [Edaphobacter sp.]|nr:methyltransferase domain-containing protein [Edaphobacter sp.]
MGERTTQPFALHVLDMLGPIKGSFVIAVAAGTGGLAVVAATDRDAQVLATDLNPAMIERTQERLRPFSLCQAEIMDFQSLTVADATADIAMSSFSVLAYQHAARGREISSHRIEGWASSGA